jgi:3-oxoacyl-[acyl-carrier protein] reductase
MDLGLKDKVALVIGATQGMGRAVAMRLGEEGGHVALCARGRSEGDAQWKLVAKPSLDAVAREVQNAGAGSALPVTADFTSSADAARVVDDVVGRYGRLDILVNTVGLCEVGQSPLEDDDWWDRSYQSVLMTSVRACRAAVPAMLESGGGAIVLTSAMSMRHFLPKLAHYSAQKAALAHFTKNLAREYGSQGIRTNAVLPGMILNEQLVEERKQRMADHGYSADEDFRATNERYNHCTWGQRFGLPDDIADAVAFLVSDRAAYVNGVLLNVDGGSEYL